MAFVLRKNGCFSRTSALSQYEHLGQLLRLNKAVIVLCEVHPSGQLVPCEKTTFWDSSFLIKLSLYSNASNLKTFLFKKHLMTFTVRPTRVLSKADSFLYICIYILCSACAQMMVLTCCFLFTVLLRYLKKLAVLDVVS